MRNKKINLESFFFGLNKYENSIYKNAWDTVKAVLREEFIASFAYIQNIKCLIRVINLSFDPKNLEEETHIKHKANRRKEVNRKQVPIHKQQCKKTTLVQKMTFLLD